MLLEVYEYATKLLNNMTTNLTTTTQTQSPTPATKITTANVKAINSTGFNNLITSDNNNNQHHYQHHHQHNQNQNHQLSSIQSEIQPLDTFNASVRTLFNRTLAHVTSQVNLSDYTAQYALPPLSSVVTAATTVTNAATGDNMDATANAAATSLPAARHIEASTFPAQTVATFIAGNKNRATTIIVYPTVSPESIVIPIVSCIFGFPILALIVICCLRRRAKLARERDRRRNYDMQDHAVSLVRFSPIHRLNYRSSRAISLRPERSLSQGFTSLELDTVMEERCSDIEQTQTEILNAESPMETTSYKMSFSS